MTTENLNRYCESSVINLHARDNIGPFLGTRLVHLLARTASKFPDVESHRMTIEPEAVNPSLALAGNYMLLYVSVYILSYFVC